jgi:endonuclease/exonuclease/phosphatase family protein
VRGLIAMLALALAAPPAMAGDRQTLRFATFNASVNRYAEGQLAAELATCDDPQLRNVAEIIQRARPHVLLVNEFDFVAQGEAARLFQDNYLSVPRNGTQPISYRHRFVAPSNTGIPSGHDLNNDGRVGGPDDAQGFGFFPGQFGMAVFSQYPIVSARVRTFQTFLWRDMPGNRMPPGWYSADEQAILRLSSKSHWDVPVRIGRRVVHFLVSHPTPPVFDGPEDRNGRRNYDEIRFWADYIDPSRSGYIYDDAGRRGGLRAGELFVIAGDQNSDPLDGDSIPGSIQQLLEHRLVNASFAPWSPGAMEQGTVQGRANATHRSNHAHDTADFSDTAPGNLRADYVLPSRGLRNVDDGVFWPSSGHPLFRLVGTFDPRVPGGFPTSDHRLVWIKVQVPGVHRAVARGGR